MKSLTTYLLVVRLIIDCGSPSDTTLNLHHVCSRGLIKLIFRQMRVLHAILGLEYQNIVKAHYVNIEEICI